MNHQNVHGGVRVWWKIAKKKLTIVLSELNVDSEQVPSNLSWHFLCTAVWHAKNI